MRQVAKSPMEALIAADRDGDTYEAHFSLDHIYMLFLHYYFLFKFTLNSPLMVACANPAYKVEDLYALIERLKSHAEPAKVFCATNKKREVL